MAAIEGAEDPAAVWMLLTRTETICVRRGVLTLGKPCGAHKVRVTMSPYAETLAKHYGAEIKSDDLICCSDSSDCGMIAGLKLKNLLGVLR